MLRCVLDVNPQKPTNSSLHMTGIRNQIEVFILTLFALNLQISFEVFIHNTFFMVINLKKLVKKGILTLYRKAERIDSTYL